MNGKPMRPRVSVIINCYNSQEYLKEAIDSVLSQNFQDFEIIFWDNKSTDKSAEIAKSYKDERLRYCLASEFTPLGVARNLACSKARGEWLAFIDSDDLWSPSKLEEYFDHLDKSLSSKKISLIYSCTKVIDSEGKEIGAYTRSDSGDINQALLREGNFIVQSSIMIKKDIFDQVGGVNEELGFCPDYDLLLKVTGKGEAIGVKSFLNCYRVHSNSITMKKEFNNYTELIEYLGKYIKKYPQDRFTEFIVWKRQSYFVTAILLKMLMKFEIEKVLYTFKKYWKFTIFSPFSTINIVYNKIFKPVGN